MTGGRSCSLHSRSESVAGSSSEPETEPSRRPPQRRAEIRPAGPPACECRDGGWAEAPVVESAEAGGVLGVEERRRERQVATAEERREACLG